MDVNLIVEKAVVLSAVNLKNIKARRLFILADGIRTLGDLYELCKFDKKSGDKISQALLKNNYLKCINKNSPPPVNLDVIPSSFTFTPDAIKKITYDLAGYVGPIASILVDNVVSTGQVATAKEIRQILTSLSDSLEDTGDKQQFLVKIKKHIS